MTAIPAGQDVTGTRQLEAWRERVMPPVEQLADGLWSIPVPIPRNPLRYTSSYAFASGGGLVLLDTGWNADEAWQALVDGLASVGASLPDVRGVLVSHMHFDHVGLAGRVREASGAWVAMHPADRAVLARPELRDPKRAAAGEAAFLRSLGASAEEAAAAVGPASGYAGFSKIAVPDRELSDGDIADVPGWRLRAVHTPGHTPGHLCFFDERAQRLFAGDHILPRITPNISVHQSGRPNPLAQYLESLAKVRDLPADEIMPAHEWRFRGLAQRADDIAAHHEHRLAELLAAIAASPDATSWDLAGKLTWSRSWDQYSGRMRISAVTETAAHVLELLRRGLISSSGGDVPTYRVVG
ncbi:MAG TPA: MBL fold metallo-hydrolase [Trebonia sp.]|nr:MBL fold metallo-hydrolase [Trebonia sp.]